MYDVEVCEPWHAVDAPFEDLGGWLDGLSHGICTSCGSDASHGRIRWWHRSERLCPDRDRRAPRFSADEPTDAWGNR
jgi:hypothetical protein